MPQSNDQPFLSFRDFKNSLTASRQEALAEPMATEQPSLAEMRQHLIRMYESVDAAHSFMDASGQIFDCIPIEQQPALKGTGGRPAAPPDLSTPGGSHQEAPAKPAAQMKGAQQDRFGNSTRCPEGTVPVRRLTMAELSRFDSLQHFFQKTPKGKDRIPSHPRLKAPELASGVHKYAHAGQNVENWGGHSSLAIWDPVVGAQVFSLSQHWYAGGSPVQTVECGWQVFPQKYGHDKPVLFIYWTADEYKTTGNYNLDATAFVQTNSNWAIGGSLDTISTDGGSQFELEIAWRLVAGNWWLYLNGTTAADAVGYYPVSLFGAGQMSVNATSIDYGGETVNGTEWPFMGSGQMASAGYGHAAYHRNIYYFAADGGAQNADLTPYQPCPGCYTIASSTGNPPWNVYFYFGGPGGADCPEAVVPVVPGILT